MTAVQLLIASCVVSSLGIIEVSGRSWTTPKPSLLIPANNVFTENSASITFIRGIKVTGSDSELGIDGSDVSFTLVFDKPIGKPVTVDCGDGSQCVNWMVGDDVVARLVIASDEFDPLRFEVSVDGPAHTYTFSHAGEYLYGGPIDAIYPSNHDVKQNAPYITSEGGIKKPTAARNVAERVWYTSGGRGIRVSEETPLFLSQNNDQLVLSVKNELPYRTNPEKPFPSKLKIVTGKNVKEAWTAMNILRKRPSPPEVSIRKAMISTWVAYKSDISQEKILDFVKIIKEKKLVIGIIGIDDGWETCYGSQIFDTKKFPDPKGMIDQLHKMGHTVTFWVHPFVNVECEAHPRLQEYLVKYDNGTVVTTDWWNGKGGMINFLNGSATTFYVERLEKLQKDYGIDGFKFDAGEVSYIPQLNEKFSLDYPNQWTMSYVEAAAKFGPLGEVRVGAGTTEEDIRMRLQDTNSVWSVEGGGLRSVIPAMLQLTVSGYMASIPDMIGGNAYNEQVDKELYVRWMQLNAFLPVMQFSILPWSYDNETLELTKKYVALHNEYSPYMMDLFYGDNLTPVVNPLWWIEPNSKEALTCNDEFLVGDQILVAPVVEKGAVKRNIYFPEGVWLDKETGTTYEGPKTVKNFNAPLTKLPWFLKLRFD